MKNLVMSVAKGYGWNDLEPFIISFKRNCPNADLVLFIDDLSDFTLNQLKKIGGGINLITIPEIFKNQTVVTVRFIMYKNFLDAHEEYSQVFVTDIRDVIFQGDIFSAYDSSAFLAYSTARYDIQTSGYDTQWVKNIFGEEDYQRIKDKRVACAGMILGTRAELQILFEKMIEFFQRETVWGDDQAVLNYLVYNERLPIENIFESDVESGAFINLGVIGTAHVGFVSGDKILREDGGAPAVVHQWTGYDYGINFVNEFYRAKEFQPNENFTDARTALEQVMCLAQVKNWNDATRFFVGNVFYSGDLTIYGEKFITIWEGALNDAEQTDDTEILSAALQRAITLAFPNINGAQIDKIYQLFIFAKDNLRAIHPAFWHFLKKILIRLVKYYVEHGQPDFALANIERILKIGLPIEAEIYIWQSDIYRAAGRKAEALAAYEKALDAT